MVWVSTKESLENREVSFLAIVEIIFAVWIYWYIAFYFDFYCHILISVGLSPLLLLQSEASSKLSLNLMHRYYEEVFSNKISMYIFFLILIFLVSSAFVFSSNLMYILLQQNNFIHINFQERPIQVYFYLYLELV